MRHTDDPQGLAWQVVFDGSCAFCRQSTRLLARKLTGLPVVFVDGHAAGLSAQEFTELRVCTPKGEHLAGFTGLVALAALRGRWPFLWKALLKPPFFNIGNWGYRLVARWRHRLFPARNA